MTVLLVKKWGNSPAVRLPAAVMDAAHRVPDQAVEVPVENGRIIIQPIASSDSLDELLARITPENLHVEQDFGPPEGKELLCLDHPLR